MWDPVDLRPDGQQESLSLLWGHTQAKAHKGTRTHFQHMQIYTMHTQGHIPGIQGHTHGQAYGPTAEYAGLYTQADTGTHKPAHKHKDPLQHMQNYIHAQVGIHTGTH